MNYLYRYISLFLAVVVMASAEDFSQISTAAINDELQTAVDSGRFKFDVDSGGGYTHGIVGRYDFANGSQRYIIVSTKPRKNFEAHVSTPSLSLFGFARQGGKWKLEYACIDALRLGIYGVPPGKGEFKFVDIGGGHVGLIAKASDMHQGISETMMLLYMLKVGTVAEILSAEIEVDNSGAAVDGEPTTSWKASYRFEQRDGKLHDVIVHRVGKEDGQRIDEQIRYRYVGRKYQRIASPVRSTSKEKQIEEIRAEFKEVETAIKNERYRTKKVTSESDGGGESSILYRDSSNRIRKLYLEGGSGDSFASAAYYYRTDGSIFFSYITAGSVHGCEYELRSYFDRHAKVIMQKKKGGGNMCGDWLIHRYKAIVRNPGKVFAKEGIGAESTPTNSPDPLGRSR